MESRIMRILCIVALAGAPAALTVLTAAEPTATEPPVARAWRFPGSLAWATGNLENVQSTATGVALTPGQAQGSFTSGSIGLGRRYDRIVPSWNTRTPDGTWVVVEARVFRDAKPLCDWLTIATWSRRERGARDAGTGDVTIDQDTIKVKGGADAVQLRATLKKGTSSEAPRLAALGVTAFQSTEFPSATVASASAVLKIPVPYRSQRHADPAISSRVCGPTSLSMALDYHGVSLPTNSVAALAKDPPGSIQYGNWSYLAATAAELGMDAEVRAMASLDDVVRELKAGHPVIMALAFGEGELPGSPISKTGGHLVLARGFDADGNIFVNDPAGHGPADGQIRYSRVHLTRAWKRGIGIVIRKADGTTAIPADLGHGE